MTTPLSGALEEMGMADILVDSQGVNKKFPGTELPVGIWDTMFDANVKPVVLTCKHSSRYMKVHDTHSKIINLFSVIGIRVVGSGGGADTSYATLNPRVREGPADYPFPIRESETTFCSDSIRFIRPDPDNMPTYQPIAQYLASLKIKWYLGAQHTLHNSPCDYPQIYRVEQTSSSERRSQCLLKKKYCVYDEWRESKTDIYMSVTDPGTGRVIVEVPRCTQEEVEIAVTSA